MLDYQARIVRDPKVCGGEPVVKGTRMPVRTILASLADGDSIAAIVKDFPTVTDPTRILLGLKNGQT
jgi:uncharacterized protein (DUF433 family)